MGALVAAINKKRQNVVPTVVNMLRELTHRGNDGYGIATSTSSTTDSTLKKLEHKLKDFNSSIALGHNLSYILPRDKPQPVKCNNFTFVFEGRMFPSPNLPDSSEIEEFKTQIGSNPIKNASHILKTLGGSYVFAVAEPDRILVGRDVFGETPLYYGEDQNVCAVASELKALWKVGLKTAKSFPPGQLASITEDGFAFHEVKQLRMPPQKSLDMEISVKALQFLLLESTRKHVSDLESVAVAFSGGVDSSVVAVLAKTVGLDVQLISVGLENQPEVMFAEKAAEALGLPLHLQTYSESQIKETLGKVLWLIEEPNPVNASIAIPFFWLAQTASRLSYSILLAGQGADELFGGYQRYLTEYERSGSDAVQTTMFHDIKDAYQVNFQRDNQVCSYHKVELRLPFVNADVIDFALRLPLKLKICSVEDMLRKRILRRVARNLDVPEFIAEKRKKAIQYTTGVTKALQKLAKDEGLTLREYVKKTFSKIYPAV